jgi:hypothetical protein
LEKIAIFLAKSLVERDLGIESLTFLGGPKACLTRRLSPKKKAAPQHQVSPRVTRKSSSHKNGAVSLI